MLYSCTHVATVGVKGLNLRESQLLVSCIKFPINVKFPQRFPILSKS